jgi:ribokinase
VFLDRAHAPILADGSPIARWRPGGGSASVDAVPGVVVLGQVGRDLVLRIPALPDAGGATSARGRTEVLGGKGANQAVGLAQLGLPVALLGVVGDDAAGTAVLAQAAADGIDVGAVRRRPGAPTALLLDLVEDGGSRRLVESVPDAVLLTADDVAAATELLAGCRALVLQLQQPGAAVRAALERSPDDALVVTDGAPADDETRAAVLARADVVRADTAEAAALVGRAVEGVADVRAAAADLLAAGPRVVSLGAGGAGNLTAWARGAALVPLIGGPAVDPTGAGDASVAALTASLLRGAAPEDAAWAAAGAAALTVTHAGGRPELSTEGIAEAVREHRR